MLVPLVRCVLKAGQATVVDTDNDQHSTEIRISFTHIALISHPDQALMSTAVLGSFYVGLMYVLLVQNLHPVLHLSC